MRNLNYSANLPDFKFDYVKTIHFGLLSMSSQELRAYEAYKRQHIGLIFSSKIKSLALKA